MLSIASSKAHRAIRVDLRYLCSLILKKMSRVRLLFRVLRVIRVRHIIHDNSNRIKNYNSNEYNQNRNRWRAHH